MNEEMKDILKKMEEQYSQVVQEKVAEYLANRHPNCICTFFHGNLKCPHHFPHLVGLIDSDGQGDNDCMHVVAVRARDFGLELMNQTMADKFSGPRYTFKRCPECGKKLI